MSRPFPVPRVLLAHITDRCNLTCAFCDLPHQARDLSLARLGPLLDEAAAIGIRNLVLTGGEPLLHPELFDIVRRAKQRGFGINVTSNGTTLARDAARLGRERVDSLSVSIDGREATHDALRGAAGAYRRAVEGMHALRREAPQVALSVYAVATNRNAAELGDVLDLARDLGADFNFWPVNGAPALYLTAEADRTAYRALVARLAAESEEFARRRAYYETGLRYHAAGGDLRVRCLGLSDQVGLGVDGRVLPCCVWGEDSLVLGNALQEGLKPLLASERAAALRARLRAQGCRGLCFNHSLYEFEQQTGEPFLLPDDAQDDE